MKQCLFDYLLLFSKLSVFTGFRDDFWQKRAIANWGKHKTINLISTKKQERNYVVVSFISAECVCTNECKVWCQEWEQLEDYGRCS